MILIYKRRVGIVFLLTIFFMVSCQMTGNEGGKREEVNRKRIPQIWNTHLFFSNQRYMLSFPNWFNENEIAKRDIARITYFEYPKGDSVPIGQEKVRTPSESYTYAFRENGTVSALTHKTFLNGFCIGESNFRFQDFNADFDHVEVQVQHLASDEFDDSDVNKESRWQIYDFLDSNQWSVKYQKQKEDKLLFLVPNNEYWNPLDISKKVKPRGQDKVMLGNPSHPQKIYQVKNMVEESNVTQFFYRNGFIYQIREDQSPFNRKSTYEYTMDGLCLGYIDSIYSGKSLVESTRTIFHFTPDSLPYRVEHLHRTDGGDFRQLNVFQYEFRNSEER